MKPLALIAIFAIPAHGMPVKYQRTAFSVSMKPRQTQTWSFAFSGPRRSRRGFSLIETLLAMTVMSLLMYFMTPAIAPINKGSQLSHALGGIATTLEQARSYAMANKTYVYVGFYESDMAASGDALASGTGKVWVGVAASKDGTKNNSPTLSGAKMLPIDRLRNYEGIHLADPATTGITDIASGASSLLESTNVTGFGWPLASANKIAGFSWVIQFSPQGNAIIPSSSGGLVPYINIGLRQSNGNNASSSNNTAVIQINGITGTVQIARVE
ncbi:MAG: Tfp pilus assembly protein FimT/FimU [Chthoniobacteraceae bacterium]